MKQADIYSPVTPLVLPLPRPTAVAERLLEEHQQLRTQLVQAILSQSLSRSLGKGWSTVLIPDEGMTPLRLERGLASPVVRALYVDHPADEADDTLTLVVEVLDKGAYGLETNRDNSVFSTSALLGLLSALETDEFSVDTASSTRH